MPSLVFLTGCGRSGTTILGELLEQHTDIVYLNDRFDLWVDVLPIADIWGMNNNATQPPGKIELTARDCEEPGVLDAIGQICTRLEDARGRAPVLIEKLAINNFRLGFLHAAFPDASFINITRHGVEVAASIAKKIEVGQWYGADDRKWGHLREHAETVGLGALADSCQTPRQRGLLEWRMSVESASRFFSSSPKANVLHTTYEQLLDHPRELASRLCRFLGLPIDEAMGDWAAANIARRSPPARQADPSFLADAGRIAGGALHQLGYVIDDGSSEPLARERAVR